MRLVDRVAYINHDIDDAIRYGILLGRRPAPRRDRAARRHRLRPHRPLVHDLVDDVRGRGRHPPERRDRRGDALAARVHVRPRLPRPARRAGAPARPRRGAGDLRPPRRRSGAAAARATDDLADRITDYVSGMTDRFALAYAAAVLMARIKDQSVRDVVAAVEHRRGRPPAHVAAQELGHPLHGPLPVPRGAARRASRSTPTCNLYHCFGCGKGGDVVTFVRETEGLDFVGAIEWLAERFRVPLEYEESSPQADEAGGRAASGSTAVLDQAAAFFERHLWDAPAGEPVRAYLASRGLGEEIAKEFRLGSRRGRASPRRRGRRASPQDELRAAGLTNQRGNDYFPRRLMFPLADARGRVIGFQARKLRDDDPLQGEVRQLAGERAVQEEQRPLRAPPRAARDREAGPRRRRRGQHRRDRAAAGGVRAGRRRRWARRSPSSTCASSPG